MAKSNRSKAAFYAVSASTLQRADMIKLMQSRKKEYYKRGNNKYYNVKHKRKTMRMSLEKAILNVPSEWNGLRSANYTRRLNLHD